MADNVSTQTRRVSRRAFLEYAALGTAGTAGAAIASRRANASESAAENGSGDTEDMLGVKAPGVEIIDCDYLVIGTGNNALGVIEQAVAEGNRVTVVDKGVFRHSGTSGLSWDAFCACEIADDPKEDPTIQGYLGYQLNAQMLQKALEFDPQPNKVVYDINNGQYLPDRNEDGSIGYYLGINGYCQGQFFRREMDHAVEKPQVTVYDRTMITDVLLSDGVCVGAMGVHLPTGAFRVFRSPATILATGGCTWIYGWFSVSAYTIGTSDNTADVDMATWRHGAGVGDAEYAQYDVLSCQPRGLACGFGSGVCGDAQEAHAIVDINGDLVFDPDDPNVGDRIHFDQVLGDVIVGQGRGTENGGVFISVGESEIRYSNERNIDLLKKFGIDVREQRIEAVPEMYEHGGQPVIDENMMTEFPGLFHARGAGTTGEVGGAQCHYNRIYAPWCAHCASEYAKSAPRMEDIDWSGAIAEYERLQEIRTRSVEGGLRPHVIRKEIQQACYTGLGVYRTAENMGEAIAEFERIRTEDLPRQIVSDPSPVYNIEWKEAVENVNMLDIAEMSVRASLMREETRGMYLRADFPEKSDAFANMIVCRNDDGKMAFTQVDMPRSTWL